MFVSSDSNRSSSTNSTPIVAIPDGSSCLSSPLVFIELTLAKTEDSD